MFVLVAVAPAQGLLESSGFWGNRFWRTALGQAKRGEDIPGGIVHFGWIASHDHADEYIELGLAATADEVERDMLRAVYGKSGWALHKFRWLDRAVKLTLAAVVLAIGAGVVETVRWAL